MVAVGGKVGKVIGVAVGGGAAVGASVGRIVSVLAVSVATGCMAEASVATAVTDSNPGVGDGFDCTMDRAHRLSPPKQRSSSKNGIMMRATRLRFESWRDVGDDSSIEAAF